MIRNNPYRLTWHPAPRAVSMALLQLQSVLMFMVCVTREGHTDALSLGSHLRSWMSKGHADVQGQTNLSVLLCHQGGDDVQAQAEADSHV